MINGGEVKLDLSNATLSFADNRSEGSIHLQFMPLSAVPIRSFDPRYTPPWLYTVQPVGISVNGQPHIDIALPAYQGNHDYAPLENETVVLLGLNAEGTALIPVGVGNTVAGHRIQSIGQVQLHSLDAIGYARVFPEQQADLKAYANNTLSLDELSAGLQRYQFIPPKDEAEAQKRLEQLQ